PDASRGSDTPSSREASGVRASSGRLRFDARTGSQQGSFGLRFAPVNFVGRTNVEVFPIRPGDSDADRSFVLRPLDHATQTTCRIEHLNADVRRDVVAALRVRGHPITTAVTLASRRAHCHVTFARGQTAILLDAEDPDVRA